jgi:hypothetical protein
MVETSSTKTYGVVERKLPALGQFPSAASSPEAVLLVPAVRPGFPPSAYIYTCVFGVQL